MRNHLNRRSFLGGSLLAAAFGGACGGPSNSGGSSGPVGAGGGAAAGGSGAGGASGSADPFNVWRELKTALRASPDHFIAHADAVVASKDPAAIHAFVRDFIVTQPPAKADAVETAVRWGVATSLRGGAGTPREKAELLASLYRRAGFAATIVSGPLSSELGNGEAAVRAVFLRDYDRPFALATDPATLSAWEKALGVDASSTPKPVDADGSEQQAITSAVTPLLPSTAGASLLGYSPTPSSFTLWSYPLVAVTVEGATAYANPIVPNAIFGKSYTQYEPLPAADSTKPPTVDIALSMSTSDAPHLRTTLVQKSYAVDDIAGRSVAVQLVPATDFDTLLGLRPSDIHSFVPVIAVHAPGLDDATRTALSALGPVVTSSGRVVSVDADGTQRVDGAAVAPPGVMDPSAAARVAKLTVTANADAFPHVVLDVGATDASGAPVVGLAASAFAVKEAAPVGVLMQHTPSTPVRVVLVVDADEPLDTGETTNALAIALTKAITAFAPDATVIVGGGTVSAPLRDPNAVVAALANNDDSDDCWSALVTANAQAPTAILIASDFLADNGSGAGFRGAVAAGAPVVAVGITGKASGVPGTLPPDIDDIARLSRGVSLRGGGISDAVAALMKIVTARRDAGTYRLAYDAPASGPSTRTVNVATAQGAATATTTYEVPATMVAAAPAIAGLYVTITIGDRTVTRTLCGFHGRQPPMPGLALDKATLDDARAGCFGVAVLSFEGAAPSASESLDDALTYRLSLEPLMRALAAGDSKAIRAGLGALGEACPPALRALQSPLGARRDATLTYEVGPRAMLLVAQPKFGEGVVTRVDVLPLTLFATFAENAALSYRTTLAQTARIAVLERHAFATSTAKSLANAPLSPFGDGDVDASSFDFLPKDTQDTAVEAFNLYSDSHRFMPRAAPFAGFWAADLQSGTLRGVLPDGSGGGATSSACKSLNDTQKLLDILGLLASLAGVAGLGPFIALGKAVAAVATAASIILDNIADPNFDYNPDDVINSLAQNTACNLAKSILGEAAAANDIANRAAQIESAAGLANASPFACPSPKTPLTCLGSSDE